jgi:hypothetical protein
MNFVQGGAAQSAAQKAIHTLCAKRKSSLAIRRRVEVMPDPGKNQTQVSQGFGASRNPAPLHDMHGVFHKCSLYVPIKNRNGARVKDRLVDAMTRLDRIRSSLLVYAYSLTRPFGSSHEPESTSLENALKRKKAPPGVDGGEDPRIYGAVVSLSGPAALFEHRSRG